MKYETESHKPDSHHIQWITVPMMSATAYPANLTYENDLEVEWKDIQFPEHDLAFVWCIDCQSAVSDEEAGLKEDRELV